MVNSYSMSKREGIERDHVRPDTVLQLLTAEIFLGIVPFVSFL